MSDLRKSEFAIVDRKSLPRRFPTHAHSADFWEALGRCVATFGFLERVLGKAIYAFTATHRYDENEIEAAHRKWLSQLEKALKDPLGGLISQYECVASKHPQTSKNTVEDLVSRLRKAKKLRDVICHGAWNMPDEAGFSTPFFVNAQGEKFETPIDEVFFEKLQSHVSELSCDVIDSVTRLGFQFPGSDGPGTSI